MQEEANEFIKDHILLDEGAVQVTSNNEIVIFYKSHKDEYRAWFKDQMIDSLKRNLMYEEVRLVAANAEVSHYKEHGAKSTEFDTALKNARESEDNIKTFKAKIAALEGWIAKPTSNE